MNDLNNLGIRGQVLFAPSDKIAITTAVDYTRQRPDGYTQVVAGVAPTLRNANRQYPQIAADLGYTPPSFNAFDRVTDVDTPLRSYQDLGGASVNVDWSVGRGRLTSTTAWRYWDWNPSSDRDFIGLPVTTVSAAPSRQRQWTQEVRYAGDLSRQLNLVVGAFVFQQSIDSDPVIHAGTGIRGRAVPARADTAASTPGLLDGYGADAERPVRKHQRRGVRRSVGGRSPIALRILPGLRFNYDQKDVHFDQQVYGGLQTTNPVLIALQRSVLAPQAYAADVDDTNLSGQMSVAYRVTDRVNAYATFATGFKSVGLNLNGVPTDALDRPVLSAAVVKPEDVHHFEIGLKTEPFRGVTANVTAYNTDIKNFQANVVNADVGVLRGYLANAEKVRVRGVELDATARASTRWLFYSAGAYTDGEIPVVSRRTAAARGDWRTASEGHLRFRPAGNLQMGDLRGRRIRTSRQPVWACRSSVHRPGCELSVVVLVERERVALPRRRRLLARQPACRLPLV